MSPSVAPTGTSLGAVLLAGLLTTCSARAVTGDEFWDGRFDAPRAWKPTAVAITGSNLLVPQYHDRTGYGGASRIALWEGGEWSFCSGEFHGSNYVGSISTIAVGEGVMFVGGWFTNASGLAARNIARFDGSAWSPLGDGISGRLYTSAIMQNDLYVGGQFSAAGGQPAQNIARWEGSRWSGLGGGVNGWVQKIVACGTNLCVLGEFSLAGEVAVTNLARWDGESWHALAGTSVMRPCAIGAEGTNLYVAYAGYLTGAILRWDGMTWWRLPRQPPYTFEFGPGGGPAEWSATLSDLAVFSGEIYLSGDFYYFNQAAVGGVVKWTGTNWVEAGSGLLQEHFPPQRGVRLVTDGHRLLALGAFDTAGGRPANRIAEWDGSEWMPLGDGEGIAGGLGLAGSVETMALLGTNVLAGAKPYSAVSAERSGIGQWDGTAWTVLAGPVWEVAVAKSSPYAIQSAVWVTQYDGTSWTSIGRAFALRPTEVRTLCEFRGDLYAGGAFDSLSNAENNIARWDGQTWSSLGTGVTGEVNRLLVIEDALYVDGDFTVNGEPSLSAPVMWDGQQWWPTADEFPGKVVAATGIGTNLYLAVSAVTADLQPTNFVTRWAGTGWSQIGGVDGSVRALWLQGQELYAGGSFTSIGTTGATNVGRWDGSAWSPLGSGIVGDALASVNALAGIADQLYVGGEFTTAGGKPSVNFAVWHIPHALRISQTGGMERLSWPATGSNFVLAAQDPRPATNWSEVAQPPAVLSSELVVTQAISGASQFYRLRHR